LVRHAEDAIGGAIGFDLEWIVGGADGEFALQYEVCRLGAGKGAKPRLVSGKWRVPG
jgi:hypothetical protein